MRFTQQILIAVSLALCVVPRGLAQVAPESTPSSEIFDLLRAEELNTVSLVQPVHFVTAEATDVVVDPGTYRVGTSEQGKLQLISVTGNKTMEVAAMSTTHAEHISVPIALHVQDDEKFPRVVLLMPDGSALEAVGSYDVIRSRGIGPTLLTPSQIQTALKKKLQQIGH